MDWKCYSLLSSQFFSNFANVEGQVYDEIKKLDLNGKYPFVDVSQKYSEILAAKKSAECSSGKRDTEWKKLSRCERRRIRRRLRRKEKGEGEDLRPGVPGRKPKDYIRCLICYAPVTGGDYLEKTGPNKKLDENELEPDVLPAFVNLMLDSTGNFFSNGAGSDTVEEETKLKRETIRLANLKRTSKSRYFLCNTCPAAILHFVRSFHVLKQLEKQISDMRAKFFNAIKLSKKFATEDGSISQSSEIKSRKINWIIKAVEYIRRCILNGGYPFSEGINCEELTKQKEQVISSTRLMSDANEVLEDIITVLEIDEASSKSKSQSFFDRQQMKTSPIEDKMPQLDCQLQTLRINDSQHVVGQYEKKISQNEDSLDGIPELSCFFDDDDHLLRDNPHNNDETQDFLTQKFIDDKFDTDNLRTDEGLPPSVLDALLSSVPNALGKNKRKPSVVTKYRSKRTINTKKPTDKTTKQEQPMRLQKISLTKRLENGEILDRNQLNRIRRNNEWAKIKEKYPGLTQPQYKAILKKQFAKEQKCSEDGLPGRASIGKRGPALQIKVEKIVGEDGNERYMFKGVEIKKHEDGIFSCGNCGEKRVYKDISYVKTHINISHIDLSNGFECEFCGRKFYYNNRLQTHLKIAHHIAGKLQCELCGQEFANRSTLISHRKVVHDKIKPHQCEYCGQRFGARKDRDLHVRKHTGERPFVCHVCASAFKGKQTLRYHILRKHPEAAKELPTPSNPSRKKNKSSNESVTTNQETSS